MREVDLCDEQLAATFLRWFTLEPVEDEEDMPKEQVAILDLKELLKALHSDGFAIVRRPSGSDESGAS